MIWVPAMALFGTGIIMHDARRATQFKLALASSFGSRIVGLAVQLLALPVIVGDLGIPRYAAYVALTALVAWVGPLGFGLLPALTRELAAALADGDIDREARIVGAGIWFTGGMAAILGAFTLSFAFLGDIQGAIGITGNIDEIRFGFIAAMGITSIHFLASTSSAIRAGFQESHISNVLSLVANIVILAGLLGMPTLGVSIASYVMLLYGPIMVLMLADLCWLLARKPGLWPLRVPRIESLRTGDLAPLMRTSGTAWAAQVHYFLTIFGTVLLVSHSFSAADTAAFGSLMRVIVLCSGVVAIFVWPLVPALADAVGHNDAAWVRVCYRRVTGLAIAATCMMALVMALVGPEILTLWLGPKIVVSRLMCGLFGLYLVISSLNFTGFNVLLALGAARDLATTFLLEAALVYGLAWLLKPFIGVDSVIVALILAALAINGWLLPVRAHGRMAELDAIARVKGVAS